MLWNPQVVAGIGAVTDPTKLHKDMHTYLAGACLLLLSLDAHSDPVNSSQPCTGLDAVYTNWRNSLQPVANGQQQYGVTYYLAAFSDQSKSSDHRL